MAETFDFIVVGAGSAGAVIAARLSEDPTCRVALLEAGGRPPVEELIPAACSAMQQNPATDWMYTADAGKCGLALKDGRMMMPRGKMLGGSSGINYMAYVRGHPGDFDAWAQGGADGWSYRDVLPYFKKSEGLAPSDDIAIDAPAHNTPVPLGCPCALRRSCRARASSSTPRWRLAFRAATTTDGTVVARRRRVALPDLHAQRQAVEHLPRVPRGRDREAAEPHHHHGSASDARRPGRRGGSPGCNGRRVPRRQRRNTHRPRHQGGRVERRRHRVAAPAPAVRHRAASELEAAGIACQVDSPHVGKHLKDHLHVGLFFPAPGVGISVNEIGVSFGPDALRAPAGPLPADPRDDAKMPAELQGLKQEAERRITEWATTGRGLISSSLYDAAAWYSTGLGDHHTHDAQIACFMSGYNDDLWQRCLCVDVNQYFDDASKRLAGSAESVIVLANPVQPHSEGEIVLGSTSPTDHPVIRMNYFGDPHDMKVMVAVLRRALDIVAHWPASHKIGPLLVPPFLARKHRHAEGAAPSDALLQDLALHYSFTVYHVTSTCRIGSVVDPRLQVMGVGKLRVADASVMPNVVSGNTNAASIMIGEKAAEMLAADHGVKLFEFVGEPA